MQLHHHLLGNDQQGLRADQSRKNQGDILWWRHWQSPRRWIMTCNFDLHQPAMVWECRGKNTWYIKKAISRAKLTALLWFHSLNSSKALHSNNSKNQTGSRWPAPEARHCTTGLHPRHQVKLQALPIFRNRPAPCLCTFVFTENIQNYKPNQPQAKKTASDLRGIPRALHWCLAQ